MFLFISSVRQFSIPLTHNSKPFTQLFRIMVLPNESTTFLQERFPCKQLIFKILQESSEATFALIVALQCNVDRLSCG